MNNELKTALEKLLDLIDYQEDKNAFIKEFLTLCMQKSLVDYNDLLPDERKKELHQILQENDLTNLRKQLEPYIITEEYAKLFQKNTQKLMEDYFRTLMPTLSKEQKNSVDAYFKSLQTQV